MLITLPTIHLCLAFMALFVATCSAKTYFHLHFQAAFAFQFTLTMFTASMAFGEAAEDPGIITTYAIIVILVSRLDEMVQSMLDFIHIAWAYCSNSPTPEGSPPVGNERNIEDGTTFSGQNPLKK